MDDRRDSKLQSSAQKMFLGEIGGLGGNNLNFGSWYHPDVIRCLLRLVPHTVDSLTPYEMYETDETDPNHEFLFQLGQLKKRLLNSDAKIQTFIVKPEVGAAHYYGGVIFKDNQKRPDSISLLLFNPIGDYTKLHDVLESLREKNRLFTRVYLSANPVQSAEKDGGKLVSCGPVSVEFVNHIQENIELITIEALDQAIQIIPDDNTWGVKVNLAEIDLLPDNLKRLCEIKDPIVYRGLVEKIRKEHHQMLGHIKDDQFSEAKEQKNVPDLGDNRTKEIAKQHEREKVEDLDIFNEISEEEESDVSYVTDEEEGENDLEKKQNLKGHVDEVKETMLRNIEKIISKQDDLINLVAWGHEIKEEEKFDLPSVIVSLNKVCETYDSELQKALKPDFSLLHKKMINEKFSKLYYLKSILNTGETEEAKITKFANEFIKLKDFFKKDADSAAIRFFKNAGQILVAVFSGNYNALQQKSLADRGSPKFWKSDEELRGKKFINDVKELMPPPPHGKKKPSKGST